MGILRIGVLASGRGSNLQAIIDAIKSKKLNARIAVVVSNHKRAYALERAKNSNIPAVYVNPKEFSGREAYEKKILSVLKENNVDFLVLAGYMLIVGKPLLRAFRNRMINIHPALLPSFPGLHAQKQALDFGVKYSGCTVHFVDESLDGGPIILQSAVRVLEGDTEDSLSERILAEEHKILVRAIKLYSEGLLSVRGRRVIVL